MLPNSSDLKFFIEISNTLNISRAAERIGVSQPALSQAIKRIEHYLGDAVLIRSKTGVKLTKAGEKLAYRARRILEEWEKIVDETRKDEEEIRGRYSIGFHQSVALYTVDFFIPKLIQTYPLLEMKLVHDLSRKITEDVISFKLDFGIVVNPVTHPDLVIKELCKDTVAFWRSGHLTATNDPKSESYVLIGDLNLMQTQTLLNQLQKKGIRPKRLITSASLEIVRKLIESGTGIGILPTRVALDARKKLVRVEGRFPSFIDRICFIYRSDLQKSNASKRMKDIIITELAKL